MRHKKNQGFTILEILVATVLIGILISSGIYFVNISEKRKSVELTSIQISLLRNFPTAIIQVYQKDQTFIDVTAADLISTQEVSTDNPVAWVIGTSVESAAPTKNTITLIFTLEDSGQATLIQNFLTRNLANSLVTSAVVNTSDDKKLQVAYSL